MSYSELRELATTNGLTLKTEDKSPVDSTPVYAVYQDGQRLVRLGTLAAVRRWLMAA